MTTASAAALPWVRFGLRPRERSCLSVVRTRPRGTSVNAYKTREQYVECQVKRHRGAGTHKGHTGHTDTRITQTNLTTIPTHKPRSRTRAAQRESPEPPNPRSRPSPAADSEETAPGEPDPAASRSQSASPRACSKAVGEMKARAADASGWRCGRNPPKSSRREGGGGDLGAPTSEDHEGPRIEHEA